MSTRRRLLAIVLVVACAFTGHAVPLNAQRLHETMTVFAAASLTDILPKIAALWRQRGGDSIEFNFDASSRLARAIEQGAAADVFFSADLEWSDYLAARKLLDTTTRKVLARNTLVLIAPRTTSLHVARASDLRTLNIQHLALAGEQVPAGRYATAALQQLGVWDTLSARVVRGNNVRTALAWVAEGVADAGVVYRTDAIAEEKVQIIFQFPEESHEPIVYPGAVVTKAKHAHAAAKFLKFCQTPAVRALFRASGFSQ